VALRDLDVALDLDADDDGRLTWREVRTAWPAVEEYLRSRVEVAGCRWTTAARTLEKRIDGVYAALALRSDCRLAGAPAIRYTVLHEVDPTHRGMARIDVDGQPSELRVLDPTHPVALEMPVAHEERAASSEAPSRMAPASPAADAVQRDGRRAAGQWLFEGMRHILTGYDHVLFLFCLLLPSVIRRDPHGWTPVQRVRDAWWPVLGIVTAFTVAHSITLGLAASGRVVLAPAFIEPAIAFTIVLAAVDNLRPLFGGRRALVTFAFGLVHGFGFAGVLAELRLPPWQFAWTLLQFNLGLELGQLMIVALAVCGLYAIRRARSYPAWVLRGGSVAAMLTGSWWFIERTAHVSLLSL
jgi:hypothetical protein